MASLKACVIRMTLMIVICVMQSSSAVRVVRPITLLQLSDEHKQYNCSWTIIKNTAVKDLTIVNFKDNNFLKDIHMLNIKTLSRRFLATELDEPNEAYVIQCDHLEECENGFGDLVKDRYWNPNAIFVVTVRKPSRGQEGFFQKLHHLYVFKAVLVVHNRVYFYDFLIANHCSFTVDAIKDFACDSLSLHPDSFIWAQLKGSLEEKYKIPYSECNMSVLVSTLEPYIFSPSYGEAEPMGYEEEFIRVLKRINFTKIVYTYNVNISSTGVVCDNFTVTGILKHVQTGDVDYVVGGTLLSHYRLQVFEFTYPHWCDNFILVVPKARLIDKWEVMYTVFQPLVWGLIFITFISVSLVAFTLQVNGKRDLHLFVLTALDLYGYFTNNVSKKSTTYFMLSWALFTWLITCFYQCDLASVFTKPAYYNEFNSIREVLNHNYKFYLSKSKFNYMKGSEDLDMGGLVQNSTLRITDKDCLRAVAYKRKAFTLVSRLAYLYLEAEFHKDGGEAMLHRSNRPYNHVFRTGYLRKGNPNLKRIRALERLIIAYGFHRRSMLAYIHMNKLKYYKVKKSFPKPLSCNDIAGIYYFYLCGCGISLGAFLIEVFFYEKS